MKTVRFNTLVLWIVLNIFLFIVLLTFYVLIKTFSNKYDPGKWHQNYIGKLIDMLH